MNNKLIRLLIFSGVVALMLASCGNNYTPKPRGYFRIDLPKKEYVQFDSASFPYAFEIPTYVKIVSDWERNTEPYWINLYFKGHKAVLHLSYKRVNGDLPVLLEDARTFVYKHTIKADAIMETPYANKDKKVYGMLYDIEGNAASSTQFYLTDSSRNFVRGALYFYSRPNKDSIAPVLAFFRKDIVRLIDSFKWK